MKNIDVDSKRIIDGELTSALLAIRPIKDELMKFTNEFLRQFHTDSYLLFGATTISQLCKLSLKGGLGIVNLKAQLQQRAPDLIVWNDYGGDCDLNLLIDKAHYPQGKPTGEVMVAVSDRIKILLAKTINATRYSTLAQNIQGATLQPPLYYCSQVEALSHVADFVAQDINLPIPMPAPGHNGGNYILQLLHTIISNLVDIGGQQLQEVFNKIETSTSQEWIVFDDREKQLLFVADINEVKSSWVDVDQSFFPYAPGRMDVLGWEVSELAIKQQMDRGFRDNPEIEREEETPYDLFRICNTAFTYTNQQDSNSPIPDRDLQVYAANESYNLSMYANNLIDDFDLIRSALQFRGFALKRDDVQAAAQGARDYTIDVRRGTGKCEFVDVAIPRILSPEWFYLQGKTYCINVPNPVPAPPGFAVQVCDFDYQTEENLNLLIELGGGLSHSVHKAGKRCKRLKEMWPRCDFVDVFPRADGAALPPGVGPFQAPSSIVANFTSDMQHLYDIQLLPDWLYNEVFAPLYQLKANIDALPEAPSGVQISRVIADAKELGTVGILEIQCMADTVDGPVVTNLRSLLEDGHITANWVTACYLLLKASVLPDVIWFPRIGIIQIGPEDVDLAKVIHEFPDIATGGDTLACGDYIAVTWDGRQPGPLISMFKVPAGDIPAQGVPHAPKMYGPRLETTTRQLFNEVRLRGMAAVGQLLRVMYGRLQSVLLRSFDQGFIQKALS